MALTKVAGDILDPGLSIAGVVTATAFDGPFRGGSGSDIIAGVGTFTQLDVNGPADFSGIVTFSHTQDSTSATTGTIQVAGGVGIAKSVYIGGDLVVNGNTTTIDTTLKAVDRIEVADDSTNVAVAITQTGSGDILNLFDGTSEVLTVLDTGEVGIGDNSPGNLLTVAGRTETRSITGHAGTNTDLDIASGHASSNIKFYVGQYGVNAVQKLLIKSDGKTFIHGTGATGANNTATLLPNGNTLNIHGTSSNDGISLVRYSADYGAYGINIGKSNNSTFGTNTLVTDGEELGHITFYGADGTDFNHAAQITALVNGTPSDGTDMPGALSFRTSPDGSATPTERLRITSTGTVGINTTSSGGDGLGIMVDNNSTNVLATGSIGLVLKNKNSTDNTWVSMDFNNSVGGIVGRFGAQFKDTSDKDTDLYFATREDGGNLSERMRIYSENNASAGQVKITAPNSGDMLNLQNSTGGGQGLIFGVDTTNHTTYWKNNSSSFYDATFILAGSEKVRFTGEGFVGIGTTNPSGNLHVQTESGTYDPLVIERKGSANWGIKPYANTLFFRSNSDGSSSFNSRDRFGIAWDGTDARGADVQFYGTAAGVTSCYWDASLNRLKLHDGVKLNFGDGDDGDLYVGSDSVTYFRNQTGQIVIRAASDVYISDYAGNHRAGFKNDGAVDLYFDIENNSTAKLSTTVDGISVHGQVETATQDFPDYRPRLNWNFASEKRLDPRITYTRTGQASYVDEYGIVQTVSDDQPRFDHDPLTGECKGLLIEDARTNQIKDSYDLTQQSWGYVNMNRKSFTTETLAPNGKYEATKLICNTSANQHYVNHAYMTKANGAERQCVSFWAKLTSSNYPILKSYITGALAFTNYSQQQFNLSTGVVTSSGSGSFTNHSAKMTKYPNGWWKCEYEATLDSSETTKRFQLLANDGSGNAGNGIDGYYIWGVQVEIGDFATSYIPTSTGGIVAASASATQTQVRGGDQVGMLGDNHTNIWNDQEGSYVIDYTPLERAAGNGVIIGSQRTTNGSGYPWPLYRHDAANSNVFKSYDLDHGIVTISGAWADRREVWALGFNTTNGSIARNGTMMQTNNTNMTGLTNTDQLWLGSSSSGSYYSMHLRRFMYYGKRLTKPQLQTMSQ